VFWPIENYKTGLNWIWELYIYEHEDKHLLLCLHTFFLFRTVMLWGIQYLWLTSNRTTNSCL